VKSSNLYRFYKKISSEIRKDGIRGCRKNRSNKETFFDNRNKTILMPGMLIFTPALPDRHTGKGINGQGIQAHGGVFKFRKPGPLRQVRVKRQCRRKMPWNDGIMDGWNIGSIEFMGLIELENRITSRIIS
jgi:hypothetical protein